MRGKVDQRLSALEQTAAPALGLRIVKQSVDEPGQFTDEQGETFTEAQLDELQAAGWTVIKIVYVDKGRDSGELF